MQSQFIHSESSLEFETASSLTYAHEESRSISNPLITRMLMSLSLCTVLALCLLGAEQQKRLTQIDSLKQESVELKAVWLNKLSRADELMLQKLIAQNKMRLQKLNAKRGFFSL